MKPRGDRTFLESKFKSRRRRDGEEWFSVKDLRSSYGVLL